MSALKKAGVGTPAEIQNQSSQPYRNDYQVSNLKLQIGEFLFLLQTPLMPYERKVCSQIFEKLLGEFYDFEGIHR